MNTFAQALIYGFLLGCAASATLALGLYLSREEGRNTILPVSDDDTPWCPTRDSALRFLTVCEDCRRFTGPDRKIMHGQHLNILHDLCPHCAKRRVARTANPEPAQA